MSHGGSFAQSHPPQALQCRASKSRVSAYRISTDTQPERVTTASGATSGGVRRASRNGPIFFFRHQAQPLRSRITQASTRNSVEPAVNVGSVISIPSNRPRADVTLSFISSLSRIGSRFIFRNFVPNRDSIWAASGCIPQPLRAAGAPRWIPNVAGEAGAGARQHQRLGRATDPSFRSIKRTDAWCSGNAVTRPLHRQNLFACRITSQVRA